MTSPIPIPVRRMDFAFDENLTRYWYKDNPWITHFLNNLSAVFPDGERFFIDSVRHYQPEIKDQTLSKEIKAFIGQEANHGKEHEAFNSLLERKHGFPMKAIAKRAKFGLAGARRNLSHRQQLAITIGLEHFTAIFADFLLKNPEIATELNQAHADMFLWHAIEETEHKAVAYDVYHATGGGYFTRAYIMAFVSVSFLFNQMVLTLWLVAKDRRLLDRKNAREFFQFLFTKPGMFRELAPQFIEYFKPNFHPWQQDNRHLIKDHVQRLRANEIKLKV